MSTTLELDRTAVRSSPATVRNSEQKLRTRRLVREPHLLTILEVK